MIIYMKSIILNNPESLSIVPMADIADPGPDEVLVEVLRVGICGTDLHAYKGRQPFFTYPRILGHELGVKIIAVGDQVRHLKQGQLCAVIPYIHCGRCLPCRRGKTNCCTNLSVMGVHEDGGMRNRLILPADLLLPSKTLSAEQLALVETLGIGAHAVQRADLMKGETILLIGAGPIGLSVLEFATIAGAEILLLERSEKRINFCRNHYNLKAVVSDTEQAEDELRDLLDGELPTAVFDATGNPASMARAHRLTSSGGRLVYVGFSQEDITFNSAEFHKREMSLLSSRNARKSDLLSVINHIELGHIDTGSWITHMTGINALPDKFPDWIDPEFGVIKAMVDMTRE